MIYTVNGQSPDTGRSGYIAESAQIIGDVTLGKETSVWFNAVIRGDLAPITIGDYSNVQDNAVLHMNTGIPLHIGSRVSIAHGAIVHGCTIEDGSLIGMGAVVLDEALIPSSSLVAAGSLVPQGKTYPPESLILGYPARAVRRLTSEEIKRLMEISENYREKSKEYTRSCQPGTSSSASEN